jgi:hypothetical protein
VRIDLLALWVLIGPVLTALLAWLAPRWSPPGMLFAVAVDPAFLGSVESRAIRRRYQRRVAWHGALASAALVSLGLAASRPTPAPLLAALALQAAGLFWAVARAHAEASPHAVATGHLREATLRPRRPALPGGALAQAGPFLVLAAAALLAVVRWDRIPERFPVHWTLDGEVDRWAERNPAGVFAPIVVAALVCGGILVVAATVVRSSRTGAASARRGLVVLLFVEYVMTLVPLWMTLRITLGIGGAIPVAAGVVMTVVVLLLVPWLLLEPSSAAAGSPSMRGDGTPNECWKWGLVYYNREDPALWVAKRIGVGHTLNFARPGAWILLGATLALVALVLGLAVQLGGSASR